MDHLQKLTITAVAAISLFGAACSKKHAAVNPPPPPKPVAAAVAAKPATPPAPPVVAQKFVPPAPAAKPRIPGPATRARIDQLLARIEDAYFDYDRATIRPDAVQALKADSQELRDILKDYPDYHLTIEGHCDERGTAEYNLGLGERRAAAAKDYLVEVGIPAAQLAAISYGKEKPVCTEHDEDCWQRNRRVHIVAMAANARP